MATIDFPERLLRSIWRRQLFTSSHLRTADGLPVTILSPGTPNHDAGPDFLNARIRTGSVTYEGDIELHTNPVSWQRHHHDTDPHYNRVILHVVLAAEPPAPATLTASGRPVPLLILHPFLDRGVFTLVSSTLLNDGPDIAHTIPCSIQTHDLEVTSVVAWLERLARERMEWKVRRFEERLKQLADERRSIVREPYPRYYGNPAEIPAPTREYAPSDFSARSLWEQLLYEAIMESLGYAKNRGAFLQLARSVRLDLLQRYGINESGTMMALLMGAAGLLPSSRLLPEKESRTAVIILRRRWKELRPQVRAPLLHEGDWIFFRLRPNNFPTARLAALCYALPRLFGEDSFRGIISLFKEGSTSSRERRRILHDMFRFEPDEYWRHHLHFRGTRGTEGVTIGEGRIDDILVNAIVPVVLLYARIFREQGIRLHARALYEELPRLQENGITRAIQRHAVKERFALTSALLQQGALQLYRFYCLQHRCADCMIGTRIPHFVPSTT